MVWGNNDKFFLRYLLSVHVPDLAQDYILNVNGKNIQNEMKQIRCSYILLDIISADTIPRTSIPR